MSGGYGRYEAEHPQEHPQEQESAADTVFRIVRGYMREHPWLSTLGVLSTFVTPIQDILLPHLTGRVINAIREGGPSAIPAFVAVAVAVFVLQAAFVGQDIIDAKLFPSMQTYVRRHMLKCVLDAQDTSQQGELATGDLISKFVKVPWTISNWFETVKNLVPNLLVYVAAAAYFFWLDRLLGAGMLVALLITFTSAAYNLTSCGEVSEQRDRAMNVMQEGIDEVLHNLPAIFALNQKDAERDALRPHEELFERLYYDTSMCSAKVKVWMVPVTVAFVAFVLWRGQALVSSGRFSIGQFVSVFAVVLYMMMSMMRIVQHSRAMVHYWGVVKASIDTLQTDAAANPASMHAVPMHPMHARDSRDFSMDAMVELDDVTYSHKGSTTSAVRDASLSVRAGDRLAVVGRMGSGKTTLMRLILRLLEPTSGRLLLRGMPYAEMTVAEVRDAFGYVPQGAALFDRTVLENVSYGVRGGAPSEDVVWAAARRLGVDGVLAALPLGLGTPVGKGGSRLSGGQRQAVWLVRMLLLDPDVLVLDEPTSAMDPNSRKAVAVAISRFRTVIFVTHDMDFVASVATRVARMDEGRLEATPSVQGSDRHQDEEPRCESDHEATWFEYEVAARVAP